MITEYQIANFKAFGSPQTLPIRPITLIFGPNSSGKSSIFQSLLMLKQTAEQPGNEILTIKGDLVDLGSYKELIHRHDTDNKFEFKILIKQKYWLPDLHWQDYDAERELEEELKKLDNNFGGTAGLSIIFNIKNNLYIYVEKVKLYLGDFLVPLIEYESEDKNSSKLTANYNYDFPEKPDTYNWAELDLDLDDLEIELDDRELDTQSTKDNLSDCQSNLKKSYDDEIVDFYLEDDIITLHKYLPYLLNGRELNHTYRSNVRGEKGYHSMIAILTSLEIENIFKEMIYIGPMREFPERYYALTGIKTNNVGKSGKYFSDLLIAEDNILQKVNDWFNRFDIRYELKVPRLSAPDADIQDVFSLRLFDKDTGVYVGLTDVGFGLSQVLPVIVQSVVSQGKTILIEQPEYHLHPRLQAELGDMFIESALGEQKNTFLIETHSEHLILRILRRIRETTEGTLPKGATPITPDQVSVVYVQPGPEGSQIIPLPITEDGEFTRPRPEGFFADRAQELM